MNNICWKIFCHSSGTDDRI